MNPKLRYVLTAVLSVLEVLALTIAVPIVVLAIVAYILLVCVRAAGGSVRDVAPRDQGSRTSAYDAAGS
jgi:hypothetical protein